MTPSTINLEIPESRLRPVVSELREAIKADCGTDYPESVIRESVINWLDARLDRLVEDAVERLSSPSYEEAREFARMLENTQEERAPARVVELASVKDTTVFSGHRSFSLEKMAAMISYVAIRTTDLYKTKLNKLLFYADFINYYSFGHSISGSRYLHLPYGPVPDSYEETLDTLNHYGVIDVVKRNSADLIQSGDNPAKQFLSENERLTLDWVLEHYGSMSASQLTDLSHREKAYRNTKTGEEIAYEYAKFFENLPPQEVRPAGRKSY
jgi:uncharacterized phage-associated protein